MAPRKFRTRKPAKTPENTGASRSTQILFAIFAILLILSMLIGAVANY